MANKRELSLALIALAGGLLVGNFAAFNGFLSLASAFGDQWVTWLLAGSTLFLTVSIIFGGWGISTEQADKQRGWFNMQAWVGLFGLLVALAMPILSLWYREPPNTNQAAQIVLLQQALAAAKSEQTAAEALISNLSEEVRTLAEAVEQFVSEQETPPPGEPDDG